MFYERLSYLCQRDGIKITNFATEFLGVSSATPSGWKRGSSPRSDVVIKAAQYFGVTADYLLGLDTQQSDNTEGLSLSDTERFIIDELRKASPEARSAAIAAMRGVLSALSKSGMVAEYYNSDHENSTESNGAV
ncbi:MAG: helix-turn-helix transcriptional regulator [Eubacteriales bacterium]|nr:helix-turn-helix transcriptional regulator [Eubacteriales bacterium]